MDKTQIIKILENLQNEDDMNLAHWKADNVLCNFLTELGHHDIVVAWEKIDRGY